MNVTLTLTPCWTSDRKEWLFPPPETGLVISYAYLWHHERQAGQEEGRKNRPSVIVLTVERPKDGATLVTVLPIPEAAVEMPVAVKKHLG